MKINYKNKLLSYFKASLISAAIFAAVSCEGLLEENVVSNIGNDYLNTPSGLNDGLQAAYSSFRSWYGTERGNNFTVFGTDTYTNGSDGSFKYMNFYTSDFDSQNSHVREVWDQLYQGINTANAVIERAPEVEGLSEEIRQIRIAEAKFIRAHHYFILVQLFGPIDLQLSESVIPNNEVTRTPVPEIYAAIINDLETAIPELPAVSQADDYGRATRPAAENLLGKVYVTKATSEAAANDDYAKAESLLQSVIENYSFRLLDNYGDIHAFGNEVNDEVIFATQYSNNPLTNGTGNNTHVFFLMEYDVQPGMRRDTENGRPFKRYMPTDYTLNVIFADRENDSRYQQSFKHTYYSNNPGTFNTSFDHSKSQVNFAAGDTAIYVPGYEMSEEVRAQKPFQVLVPSAYTERLFPTLNKHLDPGRADLTQFQGTRDYISFRLADTYLLLAEAQLKQDKIAEATENVNMVRRRAAFPGKEGEMEISTSDMDMEMIIEERARELLGEQQRWLDLKRWGILVERVRAHNPKSIGIEEFHVLRPIPQNQIDRAQGNSANFPQNPGY
ncbi:RagB/SusD family nutrient uptake outer membrane protein [Cyclobacterium sp. 1_MG-2023]|uniref:RagB/SusD family nutrient uptake outer membrane protein n=1 Tax=Cyclobacterium sp. 1_MG-2023 TaxID=3062681 RepID=UPI0026E2F4BC|nr:RagB/SusD family nutrient uptake outer membrane protein [Cyclobacterium sp. 1_MG-2023]MDO6435959.1 RagB/SusD family nutrient uptake outer membrane protein [Cyclobacterium sp. 1_MG-2023]